MPLDANSSPPFLIGANLPWVHYGIDFGANAWCPEGGVAQPAGRARLDLTFGQLARSGVRCIRWFLLCDGRAGIRFTDGGRPVGLDDVIMSDIDAALDAARLHGLQIMFVLLDFLWCDTPRAVRGVQLGGRGHVLSNRGARTALLETVLGPIVERYGQEPGILAWDIINEPEWISTVDRGDIFAFLEEAVALIRSTTRQFITVGSAGVRWRERYMALGLDFYQVHWYDNLKRQPALDTPVARLGFDRPVVLGEFPTRGSTRSPDDIVLTAKAAGYAGAFYWSVLSEDDCSAATPDNPINV